MADAVDSCVAEVESGRGPIDSVDRASRSGEGWYVSGELEGGTAYSCWVDGAGRVTNVEAGNAGASYDAPSDGDEPSGAVALAPVQKRSAGVDSVDGDDGRYEVAQASELAN
jgi:hypothetical protein